MGNYEPPTVENGSPLDFFLPEIYPGVRGYAVLHDSEIWIPLIEGDGTGEVGRFLGELSSRCVLVNVCNPKLRGMLQRRNWRMTLHQDDEGVVDTWRKAADAV